MLRTLTDALNVADERRPLAATALAGGGLAIVALAVFSGSKPQYVGPLVALVVIIAGAWRTLLSWRSLVVATIFVILFVPIRRYTIPSGLPFNLEPYRVIIAFVATGWAASLLTDPRVRLRKSGLERPLLLFAVAIFGSLLANPARVGSVSFEVNKALVFFASYLVVFYLVVSAIRSPRDIEFVIKTMVIGGSVLALFALIERRTNHNFFNDLARFLPLRLDPAGLPSTEERGGHLRVAASAQHPIALGAAFAMLVPLAIYRAHTTRQFRWWVAAIVITVGMFATGSRTAVLMIGGVILVFIWFRPREMKRLWPALAPMLVAVHFAAPGSLGSIKESFLPQGGLVAEQKKAGVGHARLTTLGPVLRNEWVPHPFLGEGFATRIPVATEAVPVPNAPITDDQWLGTLAETGLVGTFALTWLFLRFIRRVGGPAKRDESARGWLLVAIVAAVAAYAIGMFTYDAFSFIQVTFFLFILLGLGCSALQGTIESRHFPTVPAGEPPGGQTVPRF